MAAPTAAMIFLYDVPEEKQAEYIKATTEKIKPFWEAHGCESYDVWQASDGNPAFMKVMLFKDPEAMKGSLQGSNEEAKTVVQLYNSFAINISTRTYVKKT